MISFLLFLLFPLKLIVWLLSLIIGNMWDGVLRGFDSVKPFGKID